MTEFLSCRPHLEVGELAPAAAFLRDVLGFEVEVDEPEMGLMLLRRDTAGLALVRSANPGINATTAAYIGVTGVDDLHERCAARGAAVVTGLTGHPWACATLWWRCPAVTGWHSASGSPSPASPSFRRSWISGGWPRCDVTRFSLVKHRFRCLTVALNWPMT